MFVLVRHAHAGEKKSWHGPDTDRPLSTLGYWQARGLVAALDGIELRALFASPTTRCHQTLLPLAAARGLRIDEHPLLAVDAPTDQLLAVLSAPEADGAVFCTHGEVLDNLAEPAPRAGAGRGVGAAGGVDREGRRLDRRPPRRSCADTAVPSAQPTQLTAPMRHCLRVSPCSHG